MVQPSPCDWQEDEQTLYELYKQEKDHQNRTRLQALWLVRSGHSMREVAGLVGVHYRTVQEWVAWYRQGGVAEVLRRRHGGHGGQERRLNEAQEAELKTKAEAGEIRTIQDGVEWAKTQGTEYTYWGMRWVFYRLGWKKKVPRPRSPQASAQQQEAWKKGGSETNWKK
jgi:transposase